VGYNQVQAAFGPGATEQDPSNPAVGRTIDRLRTELPAASLIGGAVAENHDLQRDAGLYISGAPVWVCPDGVVVSRIEDERMGMTATARPVEGTLRHEVDVNGRHIIVTDEPSRLGGTDAGPAPHELMPAMLAACVSTMITMYANARGLELDDLRVDVVYDPEPTPRLVEVVVHLPAGLSHDQVERLRRIAKTCPVKRALEAGFTFDQKIVVDGVRYAGAGVRR